MKIVVDNQHPIKSDEYYAGRFKALQRIKNFNLEKLSLEELEGAASVFEFWSILIRGRLNGLKRKGKFKIVK